MSRYYRTPDCKQLTLKQEHFCQDYVANGGVASKAYKAAYDAEGMNDKSIYKRASEMLKLPHIAARVEEITEQHLMSRGASKEWVCDSLIEFVNIAREKKKLTMVAINALSEIAKMHGYHAPVETNVNSNVSVVEIGSIDNGRANNREEKNEQ